MSPKGTSKIKRLHTIKLMREAEANKTQLDIPNSTLTSPLDNYNKMKSKIKIDEFD